MLYTLVFVFLVWHYALKCGFISDDHAAVAQRKDIIPDGEKNPVKKKYWTDVFDQGVMMFYLNKFFDMLHIRRIPFFWHLFLLGLHLLNCYLLYILLTPIMGKDISIIAVAIWAINPMLNQTVVWISGRPYTIAVTLCLVAMINWQNPFIVLPLYALAVVTNISIVFVPVLIKIIHPGTWQSNFYLIVIFAVAIPFILWKFKMRFSKALVIDRENFKFRKRRFNNLARVYAYYVWTLFTPVRMGWYHQAGFRYNSKWDKFNIWTLVGYVLVFIFAKQGLFGWWFLLGLLPNMNIFVTNAFLQDRYTYFGSIGLACIVAPILYQYPVLFIVACTFYGTRAYMYTRQLLNDETMYRENWRNHPFSDYSVNNLSFFLIQQKRFSEAQVIIMRALETTKDNKMLWYNLGVTYAAQGHFNNDEGKIHFLRAVDAWKMCLQIEPRWRKPAEDLEKLMKLLIERKVITMTASESGPNPIQVDIPSIGVLKTS
jgi:hypothetical protein